MISKFKPDTSVQNVLLYLNGVYPPKNSFYVEKDLNLVARLYPNAKIWIRCSLTEKNAMSNEMFFRNIFPNRHISLITDTKIYNDHNLKCDVIFFIHFNFIFFGGKIDKYTFAKWMVTTTSSKKIHILFNEEGTPTYEPLFDYVNRRNENFRELNKEYVNKLVDKTDWSNVTLICNEDKISQWVNDRPVKKCLDGGINISYLPDSILYDLPKADELYDNIPLASKSGIYIGNFSDKRISYFNKNFVSNILDIHMFGPNSNKLKCYSGNGSSIDNKKAKEMFQSRTFAYSIYIGKGTESPYLGATFYEPLLNGLPLFIWIGTDPNKKLFPDLNVYFNNDIDLKRILDEYSNDDLVQLYHKQIKHIL